MNPWVCVWVFIGCVALLFAVGAVPPRKARRPKTVPRSSRLMPQVLDLNEIVLTHRPHWNDPIHPFARDGAVVVLATPSSCCQAGFLAEPELGFVAPHPVEDHGELTGDRDAGAGHAAMRGPQARPFALRTSRVCAAS